MRRYFSKILFLIICFFVGILSVSAKEIDFYFYPNGGTTATDGFYVGDNGYIRYNDTSFIRYTGKITNINSISGKKFTVKNSGTSLVSGREWYFKNVYDNKIYFFSESKTYDINTVFDTLGEDGSFLSLDLYANWENKKVSGIDMKSSGNSSTSTTDSGSTKATSISISSSKTSINVGDSAKLSVAFKPSGSKSETITWTTSNKKVATVDSNGNVKGVGSGKATIIAKSKNGLKSSITITVIKKETKHYVTLHFNSNGGKLASGHLNNFTLKKDYIYYDNAYLYKKIEYGSSLGSNGLFDYNNKNFLNLEKSGYKASSGAEWNTKSNGSGKSYSQTKVYKASDFCNASKKDCTVNLYVNWKSVKAKSIAISPTVSKMSVKDTVKLKVKYSPTNAVSEKITWKSSNSSVLTVDSSGKVTAKSKGTATITATSSSGLKSSMKIEVTTPTPHKVIIKYNMNTGALASEHSSSVGAQDSFIIVNNGVSVTDEIQTISYGSTMNSNGLYDYNNSSYINITRDGYSAISGAEWNTKSDGTGKSFNQNKAYKASDFCDASSSDCTVTLYVNWQLGKINSQVKSNGNILYGADPWVVQHNGYYYYCVSSGNGIAIFATDWLQDLTKLGGKIVYTQSGSSVWAPELHYIDGLWYIYAAINFSGQSDSKRRMYVLRSRTSDPLGEYDFIGQLTDSSNKWAIDGTVFKYNNQLYYSWSGWPGNSNGRQDIYIASMSSPTTVSSKRVLISKPTQSWEKNGYPYVNEGPEALIHNGNLYIVYSASGSWTKHYCLGTLTLTNSSNLLDINSWKKSNGCVFSSANGIYGPGHASFVKSPDGTEDWIVYHANVGTYVPTGSSWWAQRKIFIQKFNWNTDGSPNFGAPLSVNTYMNVPSGTR